MLIEKTVLWDTVLGIVVLVVALALPTGIVGWLHWAAMEVTALLRFARRGRPPGDEAAGAKEAEAVHLPRRAVQPRAPADDAESRPVMLHVIGVSKRFGGLAAVDDATLAVREGTIHAVIGPNGAGKTTLFNVITGLMEPDTGSIELVREDITGHAAVAARQGRARPLVQQTSLFWALPALTNVTLAAAAARGATRSRTGRTRRRPSHAPGSSWSASVSPSSPTSPQSALAR